ncbi:MAG: response regulator [Bacteroidia bacterium]|nr:response regulator [Bacteroidia bacterium]
MDTSKTIVIVEDNPAEAKLAEFAFKELAIPNQILIFSEGQEFLNYLESNGCENIAFTLLDLNMPGMSGLEILQSIRNNFSFRALPILVFSSSGFEDEIEECYQLGAKAYIRKPMDYLRFKEILEATYNFWVGQNIQPGRIAI